MKTLIVEGRYDALVTKLSNTIMRIVKDSFASTKSDSGEFAGTKIYYTKDETVPPIDDFEKQEHIYSEEVEAPDIPIEFELQIKVQWIEGLDDYRYGGDAYNDKARRPQDALEPPLIEVRFEIDPAEYPQILSELSMDTKDILRHEIEHLTQSGWNVMQSKYLRSDMARRNKINKGDIDKYNYWLLQKEQPAMIQGLYTRAKKTKTPFAQLVNDYLDTWVNRGVMTDKQKQIIIKKWRKLLPKLGIRQEL